MSDTSAQTAAEQAKFGAPPLPLQLAVIDAAVRIVAGPQSSHLIQDPDIAQGVAASFRTVYDAIMGAVTGTPVVPLGEPGADTPEQ